MSKHERLEILLDEMHGLLSDGDLDDASDDLIYKLADVSWSIRAIVRAYRSAGGAARVQHERRDKTTEAA